MKNSIDNLQKSYELSNQQVGDAVNPLKIAALFEQADVSYGLIGGHMLSFFTGMPRATIMLWDHMHWPLGRHGLI